MGTNCAPSSGRHLSVFIQSRIHTAFALNGKETVSIPVQSHLQVHRWCIVHKQPRLKIIWARCILLNLRPRTPQRVPLLLLTYIYYCRLGGMVNFTRPFTTNEIISISTSQTSRSWVVIFHLRRPMAFLSLSLYDTSGLARMNALFWGPGDFPVSYSNRDTSWNAWNRHTGSFMVYTIILFSNIKSPSNVNWHSDPWPVTVNSQAIRLSPNLTTLIPQLTSTELREVSMELFATGMTCQQGTLTPLDTGFRPLVRGFAFIYMLWLLRPVFPTQHQFNDRIKLDLHRIKRCVHWVFATGVTC